MTFASTPGAIKKFKRTPWRFQQTVHTPLKDLDRFVQTILASDNFQHGVLTLDQIIDAKNLQAVLGLFTEFKHDLTIEASATELNTLLIAAFYDWVDFLFIPTPNPFISYADHDEYCTFFANSKSSLNKVILPLRESGFTLIDDWSRTF